MVKMYETNTAGMEKNIDPELRKRCDIINVCTTDHNVRKKS